MVLSIDPIKYPLTGIGRYTYELAKGLSNSTDIESVRFLRGNKLTDTIPEPTMRPNLMNGFRAKVLKSKTAVALYRLVSPRIKALALKGFSDYLFHGPNFYLPPFHGKSVVTIHDLSPYIWAQCHPPERVRYMHAEIEYSLNQASMLITDSEYTRQEVANYFNWPIEKIKAIPLASDENFHPRVPEEIQKVLAHYGLTPGEYCLFVGTIEPRKNIDALMDAFSMLPVDVRKRWPLLLIGYKGWRNSRIYARITKAENEGWARYLGFVTATDLPMIFSGARLFVLPSHYEGFGLPVLEAMASGVPVVCSNSSSLPEVAGNAAAMCEANDVDDLMYLIEKGLQDDGWRVKARQDGLDRAAHFSWQRCTTETVAVYRQLIQN